MQLPEPENEGCQEQNAVWGTGKKKNTRRQVHPFGAVCKKPHRTRSEVSGRKREDVQTIVDGDYNPRRGNIDGGSEK